MVEYATLGATAFGDREDRAWLLPASTFQLPTGGFPLTELSSGHVLGGLGKAAHVSASWTPAERAGAGVGLREKGPRTRMMHTRRREINICVKKQIWVYNLKGKSSRVKIQANVCY